MWFSRIFVFLGRLCYGRFSVYGKIFIFRDDLCLKDMFLKSCVMEDFVSWVILFFKRLVFWSILCYRNCIFGKFCFSRKICFKKMFLHFKNMYFLKNFCFFANPNICVFMTIFAFQEDLLFFFVFVNLNICLYRRIFMFLE